MIKMKIGKKLLITYFILLFAVFSVTGITFRVLLQRYLINEAKAVLRTEAQAIADTLEKLPISDKAVRPNILARRQMRVSGQFIDSKVIVTDKDRRVIYTNVEGNERKVLQTLISENKSRSRDYVTERATILTKAGMVKGHVFLFTQIDELNKIGILMNRTQFMSLIVGGAVAFLLVLLFKNSLTKPIRKLASYMADFSFKDSGQELSINTGDEIEELAECFSGMVKRLKSYDVQQKRFLQNTSHELKTPLMSIQGYAEAIKEGIIEGSEMQEGLDVIIDESKRLKKTVDEMIYLVKLDNVEETFNFERASIKEIINQGVKSVKALLDSKGINIVIRGDCSQEGLLDKEKLMRAIINILSNSIRYTEKEIAISCKAQENQVEIIITDDGRGFLRGEETRIFERFYKGENGGTGIGLAITKAIVEGHNGTIEAYNAIPKGAAIRIIVPR